MKLFKSLSLIIFLLLPFSVYSQKQENFKIENIKWLSGTWEYKSPRGTQIVEQWTEPAGIMLGLGRTIKNGKVRSFEYLRIAEKDSSIYYFAKPSSAQNETPFKLTKLETNKIVFENPEHDFPKMIVYEKLSNTEIGVKVTGNEGKGFSYKMKKLSP